MVSRVSPLEGLNDFAPKPADSTPKQDPDRAAVVDQIAQQNNFPSRQAPKAPAPGAVRQQRRRRTGRNQQLNIKATSEAIERFYTMCDRYELVQGELLEQALDAFERLNDDKS